MERHSKSQQNGGLLVLYRNTLQTVLPFKLGDTMLAYNRTKKILKKIFEARDANKQSCRDYRIPGRTKTMSPTHLAFTYAKQMERETGIEYKLMEKAELEEGSS